MGKEYGQFAYEAYAAESGGRSLVSGDQLPAWADLPVTIQGAWNCAATAVLLAASEDQA